MTKSPGADKGEFPTLRRAGNGTQTMGELLRYRRASESEAIREGQPAVLAEHSTDEPRVYPSLGKVGN